MKHRLSRNLIDDESGASAVEFAVVGPLLAVALLLLVDIWSFGMSVLNMRAALEAGATYVLKGGTDEATAQSIALAQWKQKPADAAMSVTRACECAGTAADCVALCPGSTAAPSAYLQMNASGTWKAVYNPSGILDNVILSQTRTIRVR